MLWEWLLSVDVTSPTLQKLVESLRSPILRYDILADNLLCTAQQPHERKFQQAVSTSSMSENPYLSSSLNPLPSPSPTPTTALKQQTSQPQSLLQGKVSL